MQNLQKNGDFLDVLRNNIFRADLHRQCVMLKITELILRVQGLFKLVVLETHTGKHVNTVELPGFILDLVESEEGVVYLLGCNSKGNFVCKLEPSDLKVLKKIYVGQVHFVADDAFLHRIHDLENGQVLLQNLFRYSVHELLE